MNPPLPVNTSGYKEAIRINRHLFRSDSETPWNLRDSAGGSLSSAPHANRFAKPTPQMNNMKNGEKTSQSVKNEASGS
jgi:hypothetical protein